MILEADLISACKAAIQAGDLMADGRRPTVAAVEAVLGRSVTAEERDAAVEALETSAGEAASNTGGNGNVTSTSQDMEQPGREEALVYIGPTVKTPHPVKQYTVFKALPAAVAAWKAGDRQVGRLFVPVSGLAAARQKVKDHQSGLGRAYAAVQAAYGRVS